MQYKLRDTLLQAVRSNFDVVVDPRGAILNVTPDRTFMTPRSGRRGKPWTKVDVRESNLQVSINVKKFNMNPEDAELMGIPYLKNGSRTRFTFTSDDAFHFAFYPSDSIDFDSEYFLEFLQKCYRSYQRR